MWAISFHKERWGDQSLRLIALQPDRILNCNKGRKNRENLLGKSKRTPPVGKSVSSVCKPHKFTRSSTNKEKKTSSPFISGWQKLKVKWKSPPVPPKPPDGQSWTEVQSVRGLHKVVEERHKAPKLFKSQVTSTSLQNIELTLSSELEPIPWEPPLEHENKRDNEQGRMRRKSTGIRSVSCMHQEEGEVANLPGH